MDGSGAIVMPYENLLVCAFCVLKIQGFFAQLV